MSEYCEYMWDPSRRHLGSPALARSIYDGEAKLDVKDRKLAIKTVRAILRGMPDVDLNRCTDEYVTRFLLARKYRTEQAAALIVAYQSQIAHRQDIFGNLTARDPPLQRALRAGIPGVLPARDRKGRCVLVILASQWDPIAVPALSVQRAIFLVLETLIQDPRNQQCGFVAVVDWSGFSLRQGGALGAAALRNLIAALRGRFPARFKAVHFLSAPLYVQATLALVKPFLDEKTRHKIYLHGNNLSTLHEHLPTDILPAELGGTGPAFNPGLWAEPVIHSAMKEAELAAIKRDKEIAERRTSAENERKKASEDSPKESLEKRTPGNGEDASSQEEKAEDCDTGIKKSRKFMRDSRDSEKPDGRESEISSNSAQSPLIEVERTNDREDSIKIDHSKENKKNSSKVSEQNFTEKNVEFHDHFFGSSANVDRRNADEKTRLRVYRDAVDTNQIKSSKNAPKDENSLKGGNEAIEIIDCVEADTNSNEFEMISSQPDSDESRENSLETLRLEKVVNTKISKNESLPEEVNLIA
ncbi:clavesin-2-like [Venturia canescens]|uniref:clavesin-2-like n=1 Tax=Venturia canescens TaxID=32260 RepID=UPI001C9D62B4|nr:clavesin-2-like [Venturia canescens]XP_043274936.1 clavesin-2-like [Venturia canescens]XP_043274937.1 clavesin-2-like [Venturia canescens]XP_043274938.1 clavesin-2-like [Venturia canescens]